MTYLKNSASTMQLQSLRRCVTTLSFYCSAILLGLGMNLDITALIVVAVIWLIAGLIISVRLVRKIEEKLQSITPREK
ncbi:MAG: hypothetical protein KGQ77_12265 [Betaproteobacteria bacterium]|nr:hypothetical protein [Betaproteobacteria bacterium]